MIVVERIPNHNNLILPKHEHFHVRHYPVPFGEAVTRLREDLLNTRIYDVHPFPLPRTVPVFTSIPPERKELFEHANLLEVVKYLRYGKRLDLPKHWKDVLPRP